MTTYFIARDPFEPCLWVETDGDPICVARRSDAGERVWKLLASHPETQTAALWCEHCGRFILDADPADPDHMAERERHRLGECTQAPAESLPGEDGGSVGHTLGFAPHPPAPWWPLFRLPRLLGGVPRWVVRRQGAMG